MAFLKTGLLEVNIPSSVTKIGQQCFDDSALIKIFIPFNIEKIGSYAFWRCRNLTSVTFTGIFNPEYENGVFDACDKLDSVNVPIEYKEDNFCDIKINKIDLSPNVFSCRRIDSKCYDCMLVTSCLTCDNGWRKYLDICAKELSYDPNNTQIVEIDFEDTRFAEYSFDKLYLYPNNYYLLNDDPDTIFSINILPDMYIKNIYIKESNATTKLVILSDYRTTMIEMKKSNNPNNNTYDKIIVDCPKGASLMIPQKSNIDIRGTGTIKIINPNKYNETKFDKITLDLLQPENYSVPMTLDISIPTVIINEIQVFDDQILIIQDNNIKNQTIICNSLILETESFFDLPQLQVINAEIGIGSVLYVSNENSTIKHFIIYYNNSQNDEDKIPIHFHSPFIELTKSDVKIIEYENQNANLQDSTENFVVAQFNGMNEIDSRKACQ